MANFNIPPIQKLLQNPPTKPVLFQDIFPPIRYLLEVGESEPMISDGNGQYSVVQNDPAGNMAIGTGATVLGTGGSGNGDNSLVSGASCRTGLEAQPFTCTAGGTILTYSGVDLTSDYFVASGDMSNISIAYTDAFGSLAIARRLVTSVVYSGGDTTIVIDSAIDTSTTSGYSINPYYGSFAFSQGFNCIAKGVGSVASGYTATANGYMSRADGVMVNAENRLSRAYGYSAISNNFNEQTFGAPSFSSQGDNQTRTLIFSGLCEDANPLTLTLDKNVTSDPGTETMTIPDNSICNCLLYLSAFQGEALVANYGDCMVGLFVFGLKKVANTLSIIGGGPPTSLYFLQDGAGAWGINIDTSGSELSIEFTGQNQVRVSVRLVIDQITQF